MSCSRRENNQEYDTEVPLMLWDVIQKIDRENKDKPATLRWEGGQEGFRELAKKLQNKTEEMFLGMEKEKNDVWRGMIFIDREKY